MGNLCAGSRRNVFKWRIEGFPSLVKFYEKQYGSSEFMAGGIGWRLIMNPKFMDVSGESFVSLHLQADQNYLPSGVLVNAEYKLFFYDQLNHMQVEEKDMCDVLTAINSFGGEKNLIPLGKFYNKDNGFLVNGSCVFGVEFENISKTLESKDVFECWSIQKEITTCGFSWKIKSLSKIRRLYIYSEDFAVGCLEWRLKFYPAGDRYPNYIAVYLCLKNPSTLPLESAVCVDFSISIIDQINGKHWTIPSQNRFCSKDSRWGWTKFLSLGDFNHTSRGFLVNDACSVEATVAILGSSSVP